MSLTPLVAAQQEETVFQPILAELQGKGPQVRVARFRLNPEIQELDSDDVQVMYRTVIDDMQDAEFDAGRTAFEQKANDAWAKTVGYQLGKFSAIGTLGEHAAAIGGLGGVNNAMTNLGLVFTIWQVGLNVFDGNNQDAAINAYKGIQGFAIGKWGWRSLQISGVLLFVVDVTLTEFGEGAWAAREQAWRDIYRKYYREGDAAAAGRRQTGYLSPTFDEEIAEIRGRPEGGRTVADWHKLMVFYYRKINRPENFASVVETEVKHYVERFWTSPMFTEIASDPESGKAGLARAASLNDKIRNKLNQEHRSVIMAMLIDKVFPDLTVEAWKRDMKKQVDKLNRTERPVFNDTVEIELSAYGLEAPAPFLVVRGDGETFKGTLTPGPGRLLQITKLAAWQGDGIKAIRLQRNGATEERPLEFEHDRAGVVFGTPKSDVVSVLDRRESQMQCTLLKKRVGSSEWKKTGTETRQPPGTGPIHFSATPDGELLLGTYSRNGWKLASPGRFEGQESAFGYPRFEGIRKLTSAGPAGGDVLSGAFKDQQVTIERVFRSRDRYGHRLAARCVSQATLKLTGGYTRTENRMVFAPVDMGQMEDLLRQSQDAMRKMQSIQGITR